MKYRSDIIMTILISIAKKKISQGNTSFMNYFIIM